MKGLTIYRVLTFILLPVATFLGVIAFFGLLAALVNPTLLMGIFIIACVVIYTFTSFRFLNKGIEQGQPCKPGLKDWIRVNAFGSLVFIFMCFLQFYYILTEPALLNTAMQQALAMQNNSAAASPELMVKVMKGTLYVMLGFTVLLLIHIVFSFYFLKVYNHLFNSKQE